MPRKAFFPNVNKVKRPDGGYYYYHRRTGERLPDSYGSADFARAWGLEEGKPRAPAAPIARTDPASYLGLLEEFRKADEWQNLKPRTQADYKRIMDWMSDQGSDARPAAALSQSRCEKLVDLAVKELGWRQGLYVLQFNRRLYAWVLERAARRRIWGDINPWADLKPPQRPKNAPPAHRPWKPWEVVEVLVEAPLGLRRAYVLGASGFDSASTVKRTWAEYQNGGFDVSRGKTGAEAFVMVPPVLRMFLEADGERPSGFIATSIPGKPFTAGGLQKRSSEFLGELATAGKVGPGLTFHGLRHTIGKAVADSGGTLHAIQGALQHKSPRMALYYSEQADKKRALESTGPRLEDWFNQQNPAARRLQNSPGTRKSPEESE